MDYLLARIANQKHDNTRLLLSDITTFEDLNIGASFPYNDEYKLQPGEWFSVESFSRQKYYNDRLFNQIENGKRIPISHSEYASIKYLVAIQDNENAYLFQMVLSKSRIVQKKGFRYINDHPELFTVENMVIINNEPDAIYVKNEDKLIFKNISRIRAIFNGIDILYREATNEEVATFLNIEGITLADEFGTDKVSVPNRRRISNALTQYNAFTDVERQTLGEYIRKYCPEIYDTNSSTVKIGTDENLKKFIYAVDQRYYETPINRQKRVATSVESI